MAMSKRVHSRCSQHGPVLAAWGVLALAMFSLPAMGAGCPRASFGAEKAAVCEREKCRFFTPPEEIARISRGLYSEYVGLFVNDGGARWLGLDLDRMQLIEVSRFAGRRMGNAPIIDSSDQDNYRRETKTDRVHWIDVVHKRALNDEQVDELVCAANHLWIAQETPSSAPPRPATDVHNELFLLDRDSVKSFGGAGALPAQAQPLHKLLRSLRASAWDN